MCCECEIRIFKEIKKYLFLTLKCSFVVLSQWCHLVSTKLSTCIIYQCNATRSVGVREYLLKFAWTSFIVPITLLLLQSHF